jgi:hypothetical protein
MNVATELSFEQALAELEGIVAKLEGGTWRWMKPSPCTNGAAAWPRIASNCWMAWI